MFIPYFCFSLDFDEVYQATVMKNNLVVVTILSIGILSLVSCGNSGPLTEGSIEQTAWELEKIPGEKIPEGVTFKISFEAGTLFGEGPCNRYHATYNAGNGELTVFGGIGRSTFECPANGPLELAYYNQLAQAETFGFRGEQLVIRTKDGDLVFNNVRFSSNTK